MGKMGMNSGLMSGFFRRSAAAPSVLIASVVFTLAACGGGSDNAVALTAEQEAMRQTVESRQANFKDIGAAFKAIGDELKAERPESTTAIFSIRSVSGFAPQVKDWFPEGSGPQDGLKTKAKSAIWDDPAAFEKAYLEFEAAAAELGDAGRASDGELIKKNFMKVGGTCKGCHDQFRETD